jgi:hypothetical protein
MVRMYLNPLDVESSPLGLNPQIAGLISRLPQGSLDALIQRASQRVDSFCERRLQSPGSSTLQANVSAGATSIQVASTLNLDNKSENAIILNSGGGTQEGVLIEPGGVTVAFGETYPYPGTITLATPLEFGHNEGETVQYVYKEVREAIKASQSDPYSEALQTQAAQLALAHLPAMQVGLTRIVFLTSYPIQTVYTVEHAYSFDTQYNLVFNNSDPTFTGGIILEANSGYYKFKVGTVVTPEGFTRTTYVGGFDIIPDDVRYATSLYLALEMLQYVNPFGLVGQRQGKLSSQWQLIKGKHPLEIQAEEALKNYKRYT